ncbi:MAG: hypothetical protein KGJ58_01745 [Patescibacteria group bacterium]|nr:hypothetical protein [Patescibacteria group bacterium]MDE2218162.1 hypothetical protein [Patescibacteria group bacterium]
MIINVVKVLFPSALTFFIGLLITPILTKYFYRHKMWKKSSRSLSKTSADFVKIHNEKGEMNTPRVGGIIIWLSVFLTIFVIYLVSLFFPSSLTEKMSFLSRGQTIVPLFALLAASLLGLIDDSFQIIGKGSYAGDAIIYRKIKIAAIVIIGALIGSWFFYKLGVSSVSVPFLGAISIGFLFIPFFIIVMLAVFSSSVVDGIDGLAGGLMAEIFAAYATIAFFHNQIDLAAFCAVLAGGILAFLWFNIPPARFYMGETGILGLTITLSVVAFLTDSVAVLPIIAFPLVATSGSVIIQMLSKKFRNGKKVLIVAPIHHHFEAKGWPSYKVTMRFWIVGVIFSILGIILALVGR